MEVGPCEPRWRRYYTKEKAKEKTARWRAANREKSRAMWREYYYANRERELARNKRYREDNYDKVREREDRINGAARARFLHAPGSYTSKQLKDRLAYYGWRCWLCAGPMREVDHVKPLAKGGSNWPANLRPICVRCNRRKRAIWPYDRTMAQLRKAV